MKKLIFILLVCCVGCGYSDIQSEKLTGNYEISYLDNSSSMSITKNIGNGSHSVAVMNKVYEVEWNDDFILAKQHPWNRKEIILEQLRKTILDKLDTIEFVNGSGEGRDSLYFYARELAQRLYQSKSKIIESFKINDVTFYYLIEVRSGSRTPQFFTSREKINTELMNRNVKELNNKIRYDYLDK